MSEILGLNGRSINEHRRERPLTKAQGGAVITSEIDLAIEAWNKRAMEQNMANPDKVHLFEIKFERFEYSPEAKAKSELFGYAKLSIILGYEGKSTEIYNKGRNCIGFLISSGLMYNLAIAQPGNEVKEPKNATKKVSKPRAGSAGKSGDRNTTGRSK
jgi:hypothetical protein